MKPVIFAETNMQSKYALVRLSEDASGESHFDEVEVKQSLSQFAPPALPFLVSPTEKASGYAAIKIPVGWVGERHPSPHRQICFCWSGAFKVTASDGEVRVIEPGTIWLMTDTKGKGHRSEVVSSVPFEAVIVFLPDSN
jgi:quercetin dioxygenase-like cupin family protein